MSVRAVYHWELLDVGAGRSSREDGCLQQLSGCPACSRESSSVLFLPCSHPMCSPCVAAGAQRSASPADCSVMCPCCGRPVELPCWTWSSATSCLPKYLPLSPVCVSREAGTEEGGSEDPVQLVQANRSTLDAHSSLQDSSAAGSSVAPADGAADLREDEMEQSVFGLYFALDPSTVPPSLHLSKSGLTLTYRGQSPAPDQKVTGSATPGPGVRPALPQVCGDAVLTRGQYYWEVDVCNSSVYRIGVSSVDGPSGWWLERRGLSFCAVHDGSREPLHSVPPRIKTLGIFLNMGGCALSFHNPLTQEHLATLPTRFPPAGVVPALGLGQGRLRLRRGLPPPPHVFLSKDSAYRGPCGAGGARWRREIPFQSVRKVIQKFEELAVSDADSGLVSSLGSSCSTLASLPDLGPSGQAGQETA